MLNVFLSENLKYRRTFVKRLILMVPLFFIVIALPQKMFMPADYLRPWQLLVDEVYNWWPVIFIPLGIALFAALIGIQEKKAGNYWSLRAHNISPTKLWIGKVGVMGFYTLLATFVLIGAVIVAGLFTAGGELPLFKIVAGGLMTWLVSLAVIPLQLWISTWKGPLFSMAIGFVGMIVGVAAAAQPYWFFVPWSWATRLMCPIIGVHPNGVLLEATDVLRDPSVILVGIILSLVVFVIVLSLTAVWFSKREVKS